MTFDELFKEHNLSPAERDDLVEYLANVRARATRAALREMAAQMYEEGRDAAVKERATVHHQPKGSDVAARDYARALNTIKGHAAQITLLEQQVRELRASCHPVQEP